MNPDREEALFELALEKQVADRRRIDCPLGVAENGAA